MRTLKTNDSKKINRKFKTVKNLRKAMAAAVLALSIMTAEAGLPMAVNADEAQPAQSAQTTQTADNNSTTETPVTEITEKTTEAPEVNPVLAKCLPVYASTVKKLIKDFDLAKKGKLTYKNAFDKAMVSRYSKGSKLVYSVYDINEDGTPELFVGIAKGKKLKIFSIYTYYKKKSVCISKDQSAYTWRVCKNGYLLCGSKNQLITNSNEVINCYTLPKNKKELKQSVRLWKTIWVQKGAKNSRYIKHTFKSKIKYSEKVIDEKTYNKETAKYKDIKLDYYEADNKAVSAFKKGNPTYEGQKSQSLKAGW